MNCRCCTLMPPESMLVQVVCCADNADRDEHPIGRFPMFTRDLNALAKWLTPVGLPGLAKSCAGAWQEGVHSHQGLSPFLRGHSINGPRPSWTINRPVVQPVVCLAVCSGTARQIDESTRTI
jgi:hypothetical protein